MKICYFTATGNSLYVARRIGGGDAELLSIPKLMKDTAAQDFLVTDACVQCGICARVCPADNIAVSDHVEFGDRCEVCYACVHNCPHNAIHLADEKSSARFRNENVRLKDIIAAND